MNLNRALRQVLLVGMLASVAVMSIGLLLVGLSGEWEEVALSPLEVMEGLIEGDPMAVLYLGILLLIATPLARVVASGVLFAMEGDWRFALVSLLVLGVVAVAVLVE
ncbi:MAG: DUF1634 domain-containing protein [Methanomassiliicoccales archaeon]